MFTPPNVPDASRTPPARKVPGKARRVALATSLKQISKDDFGFDEARHLLWRAGFGGTPEQIHTLAGWGPERSVDYLLNYKDIPFDPDNSDLFDRSIMREPSAEERSMLARARSNKDEESVARFRAMRQERERDDREQMRRIQHWWMKRMIETPRPLEEKLTLFWHGHFATSYRTIENSFHMFLQNQTFRKHALGNFGELLFQIIRDPAMLAYLDQNDSRRNKPNENLARELMELFSLGVGNYTEQDIKEGARALTGFTFRDDDFIFQKNNHDDGAKTILGKKGSFDGDGFVTAILETRACAPYIMRKLYRYFVLDVPSGSEETDKAANLVIRDLAASLQANKYELKPVLRRLFLSEHFYHPSVMTEQIKSPVSLVVGAVRSLNTPVRSLDILSDSTGLMGQSLFFPPNVAGWAGGRSWVNTSTLFVRQNILCFLLTGKTPHGYHALAKDEKYDPSPLLAQLGADGAKDPGRIAEYVMRFALGLSNNDEAQVARNKESLLAFLSRHDNALTPDVLTGMLMLITSMPEYQLC